MRGHLLPLLLLAGVLVISLFLPAVSTKRGRSSLRCHEGDCASDVSRCRQCRGAGCVRVSRRRDEAGALDVRLTCLPLDTRGVPAGCTPVSNTFVKCVCYNGDFCNGAVALAPRAHCTLLLMTSLLLVLLAERC